MLAVVFGQGSGVEKRVFREKLTLELSSWSSGKQFHSNHNNFLFRALLKSGPMVATLHRARVEVNIKRFAYRENSNMSYRDAYGDGAGAWMEIAVNRKPTKVLFLREIQTVFGENYNQKVFETENQQNELKVPFLAVILIPFRAPNSQ